MLKKNKISLVIFKPLENKIFDKIFNRDGLNDYLIDLKEKLTLLNIDLSTYDINKIDDSKVALYLNFLFFYPKPDPNKINILIHTESPVFFKNYQAKLHLFNQVYTWDHKLINGKNIFPYFWGFSQKKLTVKHITNLKRNFACMIYSNKLSNLKNELYSERLKVVNYVTDNQISDIHLYGFNWSRRPKLIDLILNFSITNFYNYIFFKTPKCYKGEINTKSTVLKKYKFCFCFENFYSDSEYITEKIFDCLLAYTIPIYFGSNKISNYVPQDCFIDYSNFNSLDQLEQFLRDISIKEYECYIANIKKFIRSKKIRKFTYQFNNNILINNLVKHFE